jgi:hypothetical protein
METEVDCGYSNRYNLDFHTNDRRMFYDVKDALDAILAYYDGEEEPDERGFDKSDLEE